MIIKTSMGKLTSGEEIFKYTLRNESGAYAEISTLGGCLMTLVVPDQNGRAGDVLLGYTTIEGLQSADGYMGMLIGRYGNRIGGATFDLNGKTYTLARNDGENHLHGGDVGFDKKVWEASEQGDALVLTLHSPDGEEGYPGALDVRVTYTFSDDNALGIHYEAKTNQDTIINLTNHAYFNLAGPEGKPIEGHRMQIHSDAITEVASAACIPTGKLMAVDHTPFDLREPRELGEGLSHQEENTQMQYGKGYDHNFVIKGWDGTLRQACVVTEPESGRCMEVWTDQPGVQFYSGNMIGSETPGKEGVPYRFRQGFCLETQHFPDSIHHALFPSVVLKKGRLYNTHTEYRFGIC